MSEAKTWQAQLTEALASALENPPPRDMEEERRVAAWLEERRVANIRVPAPRMKTCSRCKREVREAEMGYRHVFTVMRRGANLVSRPTKMCADCDEKARERGSELGHSRGRSYSERLRDGFAVLAGVDVSDRWDRLDRELDEVRGR